MWAQVSISQTISCKIKTIKYYVCMCAIPLYQHVCMCVILSLLACVYVCHTSLPACVYVCCTSLPACVYVCCTSLPTCVYVCHTSLPASKSRSQNRGWNNSFQKPSLAEITLSVYHHGDKLNKFYLWPTAAIAVIFLSLHILLINRAAAHNSRGGQNSPCIYSPAAI